MGSRVCTFQSGGVEKAMDRVEQLGINLLAIDFDQTILSVHTGGRWTGTLDELLPHVRPIFKEIIQEALARKINVAVVTFTPQVKLVRAVLDSILGVQLAEKIPIRGGDRSWQYRGAGSQEGKQPHMASAVEELEAHNVGLEVKKNTTLLLDDDEDNIRFAIADGTRAVWFNPEKPSDLIKDLKLLV